MSLISYAQNFEDVLLWRALGHVKNGFYIDVGANDPDELSVTKVFYERGWHGINVEPLTHYHQAFLDQRPRDINLCVAAGAEDGEITLFDVPSVPGWASSDTSVVAAHQQDGFEVVPHKVPLRTLRRICDENVSGDIHFLKIDVEGFEAEVIRGMDFVRWRPWVLVIEATLPNSPVVNYEVWESMVTSRDYQFAYFDGLNRYYVALEHSDLLGSLQVQANVFDHFISWQDGKDTRALLLETEKLLRATDKYAQEADKRTQETYKLIEEADKRTQEAYKRIQESNKYAQDAERRAQLSSKIAEETHVREIAAQEQVKEIALKLAALEDQYRDLSVWAENVNNQLSAVYLSTSWRITRPVRWCRKTYSNFLKNTGANSAMLKTHNSAGIAYAHNGLRYKGFRYITRQPLFQNVVRPIIAKFPAIESRLTKIMSTPPQPVQAVSLAAHAIPSNLSEVPQSARNILADLQRIQRHLKK